MTTKSNRIIHKFIAISCKCKVFVCIKVLQWDLFVKQNLWFLPVADEWSSPSVSTYFPISLSGFQIRFFLSLCFSILLSDFTIGRNLITKFEKLMTKKILFKDLMPKRKIFLLRYRMNVPGRLGQYLFVLFMTILSRFQFRSKDNVAVNLKSWVLTDNT